MISRLEKIRQEKFCGFKRNFSAKKLRIFKFSKREIITVKTVISAHISTIETEVFEAARTTASEILAFLLLIFLFLLNLIFLIRAAIPAAIPKIIDTED